jgi:Family of unknown function (DUF6049)
VNRGRRRRAAFILVLAVLATPVVAGRVAFAAEPHPAGHATSGQATALVINSISPGGFARPGSRVSVSGEIRNGTSTALDRVRVQLWSSGTPFVNRSQLSTYASGGFRPDHPITGAAAVIHTPIGPGKTALWHASFRVNSLGMTTFGVYPLAAAASGAGGTQIAVERTFLPFWPGRGAIARPMKIAWVWPLIDHPHRGACAAMSGNSLAADLAGGRLAGLLQAGRDYAAPARLTWAVDPALLDDAKTITNRYRVLKGSKCGPARSHPASGAAAAWLHAVAAARPMFTTPYADPDVAALTHRGLDSDLRAALREGSDTAVTTLGHTGLPIAWPPDGVADSDVLDNLVVQASTVQASTVQASTVQASTVQASAVPASTVPASAARGGSGHGGIHTVVLDSSTMPPGNGIFYTPDAVTHVGTGVGVTVGVLLADHTITSVLAAGPAGPGSAIAVSQRFLAETAMIAAEAPGFPRSIVVAPPRRWDPGFALAAQLLRDTVTAPWLKPQYLSKLKPATTPPGVPAADRMPLRPTMVSHSELSARYLRGVADVDEDTRLLASILSPAAPDYRRDVARLESSAWRGNGRGAGESLLRQEGGFLDGQQHMVGIIPSSEVTLGGHRGAVPVSIENKLPKAVRVRLKATVPKSRTVSSAARLSVAAVQNKVIAIGPGNKETVRLQVRAQAVGVSEIQLRLLTPEGVAIPGSGKTLRVRSTAFGTFALVIIAVALGVLVLTSAARIIRRGIREGRPGSVVADSNSTDDDGSAEEPDELADARGGTQPDARR